MSMQKYRNSTNFDVSSVSPTINPLKRNQTTVHNSNQKSTAEVVEKLKKMKEFSRQFKHRYQAPPNQDMISVASPKQQKWQIIQQTKLMMEEDQGGVLMRTTAY